MERAPMLTEPSSIHHQPPLLPSSREYLRFSGDPPAKLLKIAVFVKKWPCRDHAGGMERHAMTFHLGLAKRGHELHIFTNYDPPTCPPPSRLTLSPTSSSISLSLLQRVTSTKLDLFQTQNSTGKQFDAVHLESVARLDTRAWKITPMAASWHGIAYKTIASDIAQELLQPPVEHPSPTLTAGAAKVVDEVRFLHRYAHHISSSDHVGNVLRRVYMLSAARVHVILSLDKDVFRPDRRRGDAFRRKLEVPDLAMVVGMAGRLVKDKGPIMFEALKQIFIEDATAKHRLFVLVASNGPWGSRYKALGPNVLVLGALQTTSTFSATPLTSDH